MIKVVCPNTARRKRQKSKKTTKLYKIATMVPLELETHPRKRFAAPDLLRRTERSRRAKHVTQCTCQATWSPARAPLDEKETLCPGSPFSSSPGCAERHQTPYSPREKRHQPFSVPLASQQNPGGVLDIELGDFRETNIECHF